MTIGQSAGWFDWGWVVRNLDGIWERTLEHLALTAVAMGIGLVVAAALATVSLRWPRSYEPIAAVAGLLYTIPSLAVFAFAVGIVGIGSPYQRFIVAEIALVTYTLLILVRNMVTGIRGIPEEIIEAAAGMGYRDSELLARVQIPLAAPAIIAGFRVATVTIIGLVTVTSVLGLGGLGFFILDGLRKSIIFPTEIVVGLVLSVVLAFLVDLTLSSLGRRLTPWAKVPGK